VLPRCCRLPSHATPIALGLLCIFTFFCFVDSLWEGDESYKLTSHDSTVTSYRVRGEVRRDGEGKKEREKFKKISLLCEGLLLANGWIMQAFSVRALSLLKPCKGDQGLGDYPPPA
jgi:hypothetical protein